MIPLVRHILFMATYYLVLIDCPLKTTPDAPDPN
jgi:hypothetical protein